ncbi:flavodoxin domain-containing protein [Eubacteriaceae bacterium ES3]|nr:flavodoxin domain-containing protein [Eubacteriaceae bacterium ES3]
MKASVLYYSKTGHTKQMAEAIAKGMEEVEGITAKAFSIDAIDEAWVQESKCVVLGSPIYMSNVCTDIKAFLEKSTRPLGLAGKLGGAFATVDYVHGGGELGIRLILDHMMVMGMLTYSGGGSKGKPVIHLGPVAVSDALDSYTVTFMTYGQRMAEKAAEIF